MRIPFAFNLIILSSHSRTFPLVDIIRIRTVHTNVNDGGGWAELMAIVEGAFVRSSVFLFLCAVPKNSRRLRSPTLHTSVARTAPAAAAKVRLRRRDRCRRCRRVVVVVVVVVCCASPQSPRTYQPCYIILYQTIYNT